jgi:HD-GYP domain-containing protein (c-di-GMP phosphodiesterase class II)
MNLPDERIKQLNVAALLHDIGKMQIPADILAKPGKS